MVTSQTETSTSCTRDEYIASSLASETVKEALLVSSALSGIKIAVVGGDDRELVLISELVRLGATVSVVGFPRNLVRQGSYVVNTVEEALRGAEVLILPMPGTDLNGVVRAVYSQEKLELTERGLRQLSPNALIIIGVARPFLREWCRKYRFNLLEIAEMDEVAILNSIPTAEGALQIAIAQTPITIHGAKTCVIGFGRVGQTLGRVLKSLGANVTAVSSRAAELARAHEMGCSRARFEDLGTLLQSADIVFNTVPSMVLTRPVLEAANPDIVIIDLAAQPGGTDFEAANALGIKAILAPGLPGKVAPVTAGKILAEVIPRLILREIVKAEQTISCG